MGSYTIQSLVDAVETNLEDESNDRWSEPDHVGYCNRAIEAVCRWKFNAYTVRENIQLAAGAVQSLPAKRTMLVRAVRNMGATGNASGSAIRTVNLDSLNDFDADWHNADNGTSVDDVLYDKDHPLEFWVYPPAANYYIEVITAGIPAEVVIGGTLPILDIYRTPVIYLMTGYAHQANRADADFEKGKAYIQMAMTELGIQTQGENAE